MTESELAAARQGERDLVDDAGSRGDEVEVVLALETRLDHVHVQEPKEPAPGKALVKYSS